MSDRTSRRRVLALFILMATACGGDNSANQPKPVRTESVSVTPPTASLVVGATQQFAGVAMDASGAVVVGASPAWQSSDPTRATVSSSGLATAVAPGSVTISASYQGKIGTAAMTVAAPALASIEVSPASATLETGVTQQFVATVKDVTGATVKPAVVWAVSDPTKATVNAAGVLTGLTVGATTVTASAQDKTGSAVVTVIEPANVTLARVAGAATLTSRFAGLSYEKNILLKTLFRSDNAGLIAVLRLLGPAVIRIGGNSVDAATSWQGTVSGLSAVTPAAVDGFAAVVHAAGWQAIYGINLARNTPVIAAQEASYTAAHLGADLLAFEIGNEPDLYHENGLRLATYAYKDFLSEWRTIAAAIRDSVPGARLSGPAACCSNAYGPPFASDAKPGSAEPMTLLTSHYYRANGQDPSSTIALMLSMDSTFAPYVSALTAAAKTNGISGGFRLGELNSFYNGGGPNVSNSYASALWTLNVMFMSALNGATGVNFHGGGSGPYTPIEDDGTRVTGIRPEFYGMLLFSQAARGVAMSAKLSSTLPAGLSAYGAARDDGGVNMVVVNSGSSAVDVNMDVSASGATPLRFESLALTGLALSSLTGTQLGGAAIGTDGTWAPSWGVVNANPDHRIRLTIPAASAILLRSL